jgi:hypothetical protein
MESLLCCISTNNKSKTSKEDNSPYYHIICNNVYQVEAERLSS